MVFAAGRLVADAADAACGLPNLVRVTGLGGFEVDVAALRSVASSGEDSYPMAGMRECIRGVGALTTIELPAGLTSIDEFSPSMAAPR
jgi:hypothetical protein